jgi:hypothetical protein
MSQSKSLWIAFVWLAVVGLCLGLLLGSQLADWLDLPFWLACVFLTAGVIVGLPVMLIALLTPVILIKRAIYQREVFDLGIARKSSRQEGTLFRLGPVTAWFSGPVQGMEMLEDQLEETRKRLADYAGEPVDVVSPLRVICFARRGEFATYMGRLGYRIGSMEGVYLLGKPRRIVVCMAKPPHRLIKIDRLMRVLYGYYFLEQYLGFFPQPWLYMGLGNYLADQQGEENQARLRRKMLASLSKGTAFNASQLFALKTARLVRANKGKNLHENFQFISQFIYRAASVLGYLSEKNRKQPFLAFLKDLKKKQAVEPVFIRHFGFGFEQLIENWQTWIKAKGLGIHPPPPQDTRQQLLHYIIPLIEDPDAPISERIQAIRDMGNAGYILGADALIGLLRNSDPRIRTVSLWALQNISGLGIDEDVSQWSTWWDNLPADALPTPKSVARDSTQDVGT